MRKIFSLSCAFFCVLLLASCSSAPKRIGIGSPEALTTISGIDPEDWNLAATQCIQSLLASGALKRSDGQQPVVMVSRVRNYTLQHLDIRIFTDKIREAISKSGQAQVSSAVGYGGNVDLAVRRIRDRELDDLFNQDTVQKRGTVIAPNFSLSGAIIQQMSSLGRTEESYFVFYAALTDLATGLAVWEYTVDIVKQGTHSIF